MHIQLRYRQYGAWLLVFLWMGVIFYLSHQPGTASSELSSGITGAIIKLFSFIPFQLPDETLHFLVRKLAHFSAYFILGALLFHALRLGRKIQRTHVVIALLLSMLYAVTDEFHQLFIPGRSGEIRDVFIDSLGALTGIVGYVSLNKIHALNIAKKSS